MLSLGTRNPVALALALAFAAAGCVDEGPVDDSSSSFTTASSSSSTPGDGDGDPEGDGDGDPMTGDGDGDGAPGDGDGEPTGDGDGDPQGNCPNGDRIELELVFHNDFGTQPPMVIDTCDTSYGSSQGGLLVTYTGPGWLLSFSVTNPSSGDHTAMQGDPNIVVQLSVTEGPPAGWLGSYALGEANIELIDYAPAAGHEVAFQLDASLLGNDGDVVDVLATGSVKML